MNNNTHPTITIDDISYVELSTHVYDRVGHRVVKRYATPHQTLNQVWQMWRGLNVDGDRYTKTLIGRAEGSDKTSRIAFAG